MADFGSLSDVEAELERLCSGADPLARRLPRRPGQKEERWAQLLTGEPSESSPPSEDRATDSDRTVQASPLSAGDDLASLRADVNALREEVSRIGAIVEELRVAFDL
jgi:hypothetical protein